MGVRAIRRRHAVDAVYEYLTCAEAKKKFKVKISNKKSTTNFKGGLTGGLGPLGPGGATKAGGRGHAGADQERPKDSVCLPSAPRSPRCQ
jgi:hypothetical protein